MFASREVNSQLLAWFCQQGHPMRAPSQAWLFSLAAPGRERNQLQEI